MNKWLLVVVLVALSIAFFALQPRKTTLPDIENVGDSTCILPSSFCNATMLTFYRCSNGSVIESKHDCSRLSDIAANWTCNPRQRLVKNGQEIIRANCDYLATSGSAQVSDISRNAPRSVGGALNGASPSSAPPLSFCGNGIVDFEETCASCPEDYACSSVEFCEEQSGLCKLINEFGDEQCTETENRTGSDCPSCGCGENQICNYLSRRCQATVPLSISLNNKIAAIVTDVLNTGEAYLGVEDIVHNNQSAKMIVIDCEPQGAFFCRTLVIVDNRGTVLETIHST